MSKLVKPCKSPRGKKLQRLTCIDGYMLVGTPEQASSKILGLRERFPDKRSLVIKWERDAWDEDYSLVVYWMRDETDSEWAERDNHERALKRDRVLHLERELERARKDLEKRTKT